MLTDVQQKKLAKLQATAAGDLSDKQLLKLAKLRAKAAKHKDAAQEQAVGEAARANHKRKADDTTAAAVAPSVKRVYKAEPCRDQGHWGADNEWVYPDDKELVCSTCKASFTFTGTDQAWYAKKELFAPARCAECIASKKEARHKKQQAGVSSTHCFNCGQEGHAASACPQQRSEAKMCYVCGSSAHLSRNCPSAKSKRSCFTCGSTAYLSKECPQRPAPVCHNCGEVGHAKSTCIAPARTSGACFAFAAGQCFSKKCKFAHAE